MNRRWLVIGLLIVVPAASGQNVFVTVEDGTPKIVKQIHLQTPMVETGGKLVRGGGSQYGLARATVYRPGLVSFDKDLRVGVWHVEVRDTTSVVDSVGYELRVRGGVTADTALQHCFMVVDLVELKWKGIAFAEMPDLAAGEEVPLDLVFPLNKRAESGSYRLHIFSNGVEVLHSKMAPAYLERQKQKMTALLSSHAQDFPAILAHSVTPIYPEELKKSGTTGSAQVRCHVTKTGDVASVELVRASAPAFGVAALAAVPKWKFDPAIKQLQFVEADVEVPVEFKLPPKS